ncbi:CAP domain-containing protein [Meiothermus sp. QL-1]|nr:CAP domain-containing protein [Meiothermus sp. QL-1]
MRAVGLCLVLLAGALAQSPLELEVLRRTNEARQAQGLGPLVWDALAHRAALHHAQDMLKRNYFAHRSPEGQGPAERLQRAGVLEVAVGENLAQFAGYPEAEVPRRALEGWLESPGHRANLLNPRFTHLGVGLVREGRRVVVVQNFVARPFELGVERAPVQAERTILRLSGTAPGTLGVFLGDHLFARLEPPISAHLELPPGAQVRYALYDGKGWWAVRNGEQGLSLEVALERRFAPGQRVDLRLPRGAFVLALGAEPRLWQSVEGPARLTLTLPSTLGALWVGQRQGGRVLYTHRIPLS